MNKLLKNRTFVVSLVIVVLILGAVVIAWQSALYTLNKMTFKQVSPTQMAASMRLDEFWSNYRFNTLVFSGEVKSVSTVNAKTTVVLKTSDPYSVTCIMSSPKADLKLGKTYTFAVQTYQAERQPKGVLLHNCINP